MTSPMTAAEVCRSWELTITADTATTRLDRSVTRLFSLAVGADVGVGTPELTNDDAGPAQSPADTPFSSRRRASPGLDVITMSSRSDLAEAPAADDMSGGSRGDL